MAERGHVACDERADVRSCLVLGVAVLAGCSSPVTTATPDAADTGDPDDAGDPVADTTPPGLAAIAPAPSSSVWLHAPIRLVFDEPLDPASASASEVTVQLGGEPVAATIVFDAPNTLAIELDPALRGVGTLAIEVDARATDLAGNTFVDAIAATYAVPAWDAASIDRGPAAGIPTLALDGRGTALAAWLVGGTGARRVAASELAGAQWHDLGATLGTGDVTSTAAAFDASGAPLVAWSDDGVAHVARWTGNTWSELPSPGAGSYVALVTPDGGAPIVAVFGATAVVSELTAGDVWQPLGAPLTPPASYASEPVLAAGALGRPAIGWVDTAGQLRAYRLDASWTALAPIAVGADARVALAAHGTALAIAWDQRAGSYAVLAARAAAGATTWTQLGRPLDIDIAGDARAPAIAFDASGAPLVAWTELVETAWRGGLARWSGAAWEIVGGVSWLASADTQPAGARLVVAPGGAALVGTTAAGSLQLARFNGPRTAGPGLAQRAPLAGCAVSASAPPALLSQTGCFDLATPKHPSAHAGLVPYDVVSELWSDGARKRRWIGLPAGQSMTLGSNGAWAAPVDTMLVKEFAIETTPGDPHTRRPVETRFLVNDAQLGWRGFSYRWNAAGTDAELLPDAPLVASWPLDTGGQHAHVYPSRTQCRSCHATAQGPVLGLRPEQLARWFDYDGVIADQLATLATLGVGPASAAPALVSPHDPTASVERRMRGYMAANCAHCHNPQYISIKDMRFATPLAQTRLCEVIVPGSPAQSEVYRRVTNRPGMPPLGTVAVDALARDLLGAWISQMTSCP